MVVWNSMEYASQKVWITEAFSRRYIAKPCGWAIDVILGICPAYSQKKQAGVATGPRLRGNVGVISPVHPDPQIFETVRNRA
jgi:hypothetical protein